MSETLNAGPLKTGEASIDAEHDLQMQLLDSLSQSLASGGDSSTTRHILEQLIEFSDMHFLSEQLIMRLHSYPAYEAHFHEHTRLMKKVRQIHEDVVQGKSVSGLQLILELRDWLLNHMTTEDAAFSEFLSKERPSKD
jgi:hemerythrin